MPMGDALPVLFPQHASKWARWLELLKGLDIDTVFDVCVIEEAIWETVQLPPVLKSGLSMLREAEETAEEQQESPSSTETSTSSVTAPPTTPPPSAPSTGTPATAVASPSSPSTMASPVLENKERKSPELPVRSSVIPPPPSDGHSELTFPEEGGLSAADFSSSDSDEEGVGKIRKMIAKPQNGYAFPVVKGNKYGVKQNRVIVIDEQSGTLKFCDTNFKLKSEVPFAQILVAAVVGNDKKITVTFKQRSRVYDVTFADAKSCETFRKNYDTADFMKSHSPMTRTFSSMTTADLLHAENEVVEISNYQEYRVIKKNKFRNRQQRIIVLKPKSLLLLDSQRKFIKAFPYDQIFSVEFVATDDKKKDSSPEVEAFLVFQKATAQRPFQIFFPDAFDRNHFTQSLKSVHRKLILKDEDDGRHRFVVTKLAVNIAQGVRQGKARILEVLVSECVIRSYDRIKQFKDTHFANIQQIEPCVADNRRIFLSTTKKFAFDFPDHLSRARFLALTTFLLDSVHEETPGHKVSIFCGTWNVGSSAPVDSISNFIPSNTYDLYAIGLQECPHTQREAWVAEIQRQIGGSGAEFTSLSDKERDEQSSYQIVGSAKLWEISLVVFARRDMAYKVTCREVATVACGVGDVLGNKGGAAVFFRIEDTTLCFLTCHLAARAERIKERRQDFLKITKMMRFGDRDVDLLMQCDHMFWFGDLNYRVEKGFHLAVAAAEGKRYEELMQADQLRREMSHKRASDLCYPEFHEGSVNFAPTYRWEKTCNVFSNKREQAPSYTDRVLWHSLHSGQLTQDSYGASPDVFGSDHRPVFATFTMTPRSFKWGNYTEMGDSRVDILLHDLVLDSQDLDARAEFQLAVTAPILLEEFASGFTKLGEFRDGWKWPEQSFRAYVQPSHIAGFRLLIAIRALPLEPRETVQYNPASRPDTIAFCSVALAAGPSRFQVNATKDGLVLGRLSGRMSFCSTEETTRPSKQQSSANLVRASTKAAI